MYTNNVTLLSYSPLSNYIYSQMNINRKKNVMPGFIGVGDTRVIRLNLLSMVATMYC
jgi:hypothetical protein